MFAVLFASHTLVHVNATLNAISAILLVVGLVLIKKRREQAHKTVMLLAFGVSIAFLACYLWYHFQVGSVRFTHPGPIRVFPWHEMPGPFPSNLERYRVVRRPPLSSR